jgi:hypothetical protein
LVPTTWLGLETAPPSPQLVDHLDLKPGFGLIVTHVMEESPAAKAGVKVNDILLRLGDQELVNFEQLSVLVRSKGEGDKVMLTVLRKGKEQKLEVVLGTRDMPEGWRVPDVRMRVLPMPPGQGGTWQGQWIPEGRGFEEGIKEMERRVQEMKRAAEKFREEPGGWKKEDGSSPDKGGDQADPPKEKAPGKGAVEETQPGTPPKDKASETGKNKGHKPQEPL